MIFKVLFGLAMWTVGWCLSMYWNEVSVAYVLGGVFCVELAKVGEELSGLFYQKIRPKAFREVSNR